MNRVIGASRFDVQTYEEVEADHTALGQAMAVVVISSIAGGIGIGETAEAAVAVTVVSLMGWAFWAWITYVIGVRIFPTTQTDADWGQLLRTTGFSASPGVLRILGILPGLTRIVFLICAIWMLAAFVIAVRQALDYVSVWRAVGVCCFGWFVYVILFFVLDRSLLY
jgi:hypothetical protein